MEQFIGLIREYIALVDRCSEHTAREFLLRCASLLPRIYALGIQLPDVDLPEREMTWETLSNCPLSAISELLGKYDEYAEVFDPVLDREFLLTHLSDDLTDIYSDLRVPLTRYERGGDNDRAEAIWQWQFNLRGHCGDHLVDAMRPIHRLVFDHLDPQYSALHQEVDPFGAK